MHKESSQTEYRRWIQQLIVDYWPSPQNSMELQSNEPAWAKPLIGVARGSDPLFTQLQEEIGPFYWIPLEAFKIGFPESPVEVADLSVIVYVLPQTETTAATSGLCQVGIPCEGGSPQ